MVPAPPAPDRRERRLRRAERLRPVAERLAFGLNGLTFLISALDGLDPATHAPRWSVAALVALGAAQLGALALALRARGSLPERLPFGLGALGMAVSALVVRHHHTGLPYAYALAGLVYAALAWKGPEFLRPIVRRGGRADAPTLPEGPDATEALEVGGARKIGG